MLSRRYTGVDINEGIMMRQSGIGVRLAGILETLSSFNSPASQRARIRVPLWQRREFEAGLVSLRNAGLAVYVDPPCTVRWFGLVRVLPVVFYNMPLLERREASARGEEVS